MDIQLLEKAISHFGCQRQITKAIEEMGELTVDLARYLNGKGMMVNLLGEIADASIMIEQLKLIFGKELVDSHIALKLQRLRLMMDVPDPQEGDNLR